MTEWKAEAGEDAVVRVRAVSSGGEVAWLEGGGSSPISALRPLPPALSAEDAAVLRAADAQERRGDEWRYSEIGDAEELRIAYMRATDATNCATRARRRSTPPAADVPQDGAWVPKVGDRVRVIGGFRASHIGTIESIDPPTCWVAVNRNGIGVVKVYLNEVEAAHEPTSSAPAAGSAAQPGAGVAALRDAVVEAVRVYREKRKQYHRTNSTAAGSVAVSKALEALDAAHDALLAAEAPADPVAELREAAEMVVKKMAYAPGEHRELDRLRAALSAIGDRGRG